MHKQKKTEWIDKLTSVDQTPDFVLVRGFLMRACETVYLHMVGCKNWTYADCIGELARELGQWII